MATKRAPARPAPKKPLSPGAKAIKQQYGTFLGAVDPATGKRPTISRQSAMNSMFSSPTLASGAANPNYRPPGGTGNTPFMNSKGARMGFWNDVTQNFDILGKKARAGHAKAMGGTTQAAVDSTSVLGLGSPGYAGAVENTTANAAMGGKGRTGSADFGVSGDGDTGAAKKGGALAPTKRQKKNLRVRGHRQKSGVAPGKHINKAGNIVANKGKRGK